MLIVIPLSLLPSLQAARREQMAHAARANAAVIETLEQELAFEREARIHAEQLVLELEFERARAEPPPSNTATNVEDIQQQPEISPRGSDESIDNVTPLRPTTATTPDHTPSFGRAWAATRNSILLLSTDRLVDNGLSAPLSPTSATSSGHTTPQLSPRAGATAVGPSGTPVQVPSTSNNNTPLASVASPRMPPTVARRPSYSPLLHANGGHAPTPSMTPPTNGRTLAPPTPSTSSGVAAMFSPGDASLSVVVSAPSGNGTVPSSSPNNNNNNPTVLTPSLYGVLSTSRLEQLRSVSGHRRGRSGARSRRTTVSGAAALAAIDALPTTPQQGLPFASRSSSQYKSLPRPIVLQTENSNESQPSHAQTTTPSTTVTITAPSTPGAASTGTLTPSNINNIATPPTLIKTVSLSVTPSYSSTGTTLATPGSGPSPIRHIRGTSSGQGSAGGGMYAQLMRLEDDIKRLKIDLRNMESAKLKAETALTEFKAVTTAAAAAVAAVPQPTATSEISPEALRDQLKTTQGELKIANDCIIQLTTELSTIKNELEASRIAEQRADVAEAQASEVGRRAISDLKVVQEQARTWSQQHGEAIIKIRSLESAAGTRAAELAEATRQLVLLRAQSTAISMAAITPTSSLSSVVVMDVNDMTIMNPTITRAGGVTPVEIRARQSTTVPAVTPQNGTSVVVDMMTLTTQQQTTSAALDDAKRLRALEESLSRRETALLERERELASYGNGHERILKAERELALALEETRRANMKAHEHEDRLRSILAKAKGMTHHNKDKDNSPSFHSYVPPPVVGVSSQSQPPSLELSTYSTNVSSAPPQATMASTSSSSSLSSSSSSSGSGAAPAEARRSVCARTSLAIHTLHDFPAYPFNGVCLSQISVSYKCVIGIYI
jgi:hypothetical protein